MCVCLFCAVITSVILSLNANQLPMARSFFFTFLLAVSPCLIQLCTVFFVASPFKNVVSFAALKNVLSFVFERIFFLSP